MRPIVLSGFMATGKSTVGRLVAERLGLPFVDTDAILAEQAGCCTGELFAREGEARFREWEADLVLPMLADPSPRVLSFGGGTMAIGSVRRTALDAATVVTLTASARTIVARAASLAERPNLATRSPVERAEDLLALRREVYAECHACLSTDEATPEQLADRIVALCRVDSLAVPLGARSYRVEIVDGEPQRLREVSRDLAPSSIFVVTDTNVLGARRAWLDEAGLAGPLHVIAIPPGEPSKTLATVAGIWDDALGRGVDRSALVVAFGGGVVGDLAGFAASTLLRGLNCVQVATSLLAMVDSSVGGKTGFDVAAGKNLVGTFTQPRRVIVDLEHLTTLPRRQLVAGLAEVAKIALIRDRALLADLERSAERLAAGDRAALHPVVRAAIKAKIRVVRDDEREAGARGLLNLGHTIGHALEAHGGYARILHGEAVAAGTVLEIRACERLGLSPTGAADRADALLRRLGLTTTADRSDLQAAWPFVLADKKRAAGHLRLPVVTGDGEGEMRTVPLSALRDALLR